MTPWQRITEHSPPKINNTLAHCKLPMAARSMGSQSGVVRLSSANKIKKAAPKSRHLMEIAPRPRQCGGNGMKKCHGSSHITIPDHVSATRPSQARSPGNAGDILQVSGIDAFLYIKIITLLHVTHTARQCSYVRTNKVHYNFCRARDLR